MKSVLSTSSIFLMHKYWGKKPAEELKKIILSYSKEGDLIFDPFAGFGGLAIEGILHNRNVIINDLNPSATFISRCILDQSVDIEKLKELFLSIKQQYKLFEKEWYSFKDGKILTILRDNFDNPLKVKIKEKDGIKEIDLTNDEMHSFLCKENDYIIKTWFPNDQLIVNSRIGAKKGMTVADLFPKRALICQSFLYNLILKCENCIEKDLLLFSFTSNLANCSKLVPPITSRGKMAQGAWMTGFYVGKTYLENNVFHYFESRLLKTIKGKETYLKLRKKNQVHTTYLVMNDDAKNLRLNTSSVDFIFTDFPYGDTVPYFEQSQLWNLWLKNKVDYKNEIVISDSKERFKDIIDFSKGIDKSISEIYRVLKDNKYFVFTFHSLAGDEWQSIVQSLCKYNFEFQNCEVLIQKTFSPRQLNRKNSIKGDVIAVYRKTQHFIDKTKYDFFNVLKKNIMNNENYYNKCDVNDIIILFIRTMLETYYCQSIDFEQLIYKYFEYDKVIEKWRIKNELQLFE